MVVFQQIKLAHNWSEVHRSAGHPCPSTCLATYADDTILSGGEDGRLVLLTPGRAEPTQVLGLSLLFFGSRSIMRNSALVVAV